MRALSPNISVRDLYLRSCWTNEITKVEQILRLRADVNWKDQDGWSGLLIAADKNYRDLLELLLTQSGVNVNIADRYNSTPLMMVSPESLHRRPACRSGEWPTAVYSSHASLHL